jgi:hypothetical protein
VTPAQAAADAVRVRDYIRTTAQARARLTRSVPTTSNFYRRLTGHYLTTYLASPTPANGRAACETGIGRTFAGPATPGDAWEEGALAQWNRQPIPASRARCAQRCRPSSRRQPTS